MGSSPALCSVILLTTLYCGLPWWLKWWRIGLQCRRPRSDPWVRKIPWRWAWLPPPVLAGRIHGQRSLTGYSSWRCKESDMTKQHSLHFTSSHFTVTMYLLVSHTRWLWQELWLLFIWLILRCVDRCAKLTLVFMMHESGQDPTPIFIHLLRLRSMGLQKVRDDWAADTHKLCVYLLLSSYPPSILLFP